MFKQTIMAAALALGTASVAIPASAQQTRQNGLVNVAVGDVILRDILTDVEINALNDLNLLNNNQIQVQAPIGVAATVCNVSAAVLARGGDAGGQCTAESGSQALAQAIRKQHLKNR